MQTEKTIVIDIKLTKALIWILGAVVALSAVLLYLTLGGEPAAASVSPGAKRGGTQAGAPTGPGLAPDNPATRRRRREGQPPLHPILRHPGRVVSLRRLRLSSVTQGPPCAGMGRDAHASHHVVAIRRREQPHSHERHDLLVVLLRGYGSMLLGDEERPLGVGSILYVPRGTPHAFRNASAQPAVAYAVYVPAFDGRDRVELD